MDASALSFTDVSKVYDGAGSAERYALRDVTFDVAAGKTVAIVGRSGSGKSTLLHLAAGIDVPTRGSVALYGAALNGLGETERTRLRRRDVGFVFQLFHLLPHLTVRDNVALPDLIAGVRERAYRQRVAALLERVGLPDRAGDPVAGLSGGEMQRVAICRALLRRPRLLLADEPTGSLDDASGQVVMDLMLQMVAEEGRHPGLRHPQPRAGRHGGPHPAAPQRHPGGGVRRPGIVSRTMLRYFCKTVSAHWRTNPVLYGLTVLGVALGVASVISIRILNQSAVASFAAGVRTIGGAADVVVTGKAGTLPDAFYPLVRGTPGVARAWPVFESTVAVEGRPGTFVRLLGVDLLAPAPELRDALSAFAPGAVAAGGRGWAAATPALARTMGWVPGDRFKVRDGAGVRELRLGALIDFERWGASGGGRALVMDIAGAQSLFGGAGDPAPHRRDRRRGCRRRGAGDPHRGPARRQGGRRHSLGAQPARHGSSSAPSG